jgi:hypothetical protein
VSVALLLAAVEPARPRQRRRWLLVTGLVILVVLAVGLVAYAGGGQRTGSLDPDATDPTGARALSRLLQAQGVTVVSTNRAQSTAAALRAAGPNSTLLVTLPTMVSTRMATALSGLPIQYVVLVGAVPTEPGPWPAAASVDSGQSTAVQDRLAACSWPPATLAGAAETGGAVFAAPRSFSCYQGSVVDIPAGTASIPPDVRGSVTLLGTGSTLTNANLGDSGNAALSMSVLGRTPTLVWWRPSIADPLMYADGQQPAIGDLVPPWVLWVSLQLVIAVLVLAYARGRRLGPVATEPLPVTVRAAESTEGLARLYQRARGREHAATKLASATAVRLRAALRLPRGATVSVLAQVVADRIRRPTIEVLALLVPTEPLDDAALVRFADDLDALERQVHRP